MPTNGFASFRYVSLCGLSINAKCPKMNTHFPLIVADCQTALTSPPSSLPSLSLSLTRWQPPRKLKCAPNVISPVAHWVPPLPPILHFSHAFYFFVAPLNGMKVYKLSNSFCRQSVPASCQLPDANCQMPVNFWSSPKLSHDIQMA